MIVVFSHIDFIPDEFQILIQLFENGLEKLHLKKLGNIAQWRGLLTQIPEKFRKKIVIHSNYELQQEFPEIQLHSGQVFESEGRFISSSAHNMEELEKKISQFDYVFLSPIYTSLSKDKYSPMEDFELAILTDEEKQKVVGLGGVEYERLVDLRIRGFLHIALLGTIWNHPETALANFLKIKKEWESLGNMF